MKNNILGDLHVHTPLSHCGRLPSLTVNQILGIKESHDDLDFRDEVMLISLEQILTMAQYKNLACIGLSDHFPERRAHAYDYAWPKIRNWIKQTPMDIDFFLGAECTIHENGTIKITEKEKKALDYVLGAPFHWHTSFIQENFKDDEQGAVEFTLKEILAALDNPLIDGLVHVYPISGSKVFYDFDKKYITMEYAKEIAKKAEKTGKALEISARFDLSTDSHYHQVLQQWFQTDCKLFYGSDAHIPHMVGRKSQQVKKILETHKVDPQRIWFPSTK